MCPFSKIIDNNRFSCRAYDVLSHRVLVPGMGFIGSGLKSNWKVIGYAQHSWHHCTRACLTRPVIVVHKVHSLGRLRTTFLLQKHA